MTSPEIERLVEAARDAETQLHFGTAGTRRRADDELAAAIAALQSIPEPLLDEGLVDQVAEAICDCRYQNEPRWPELPDDIRELWREYARAALSIPRLEAGRVTEAMIEAGAREFRQAHQNTCYPDASDNEARWAAEAIYLAMSSTSAPDGEDR